MSFRLVPKSVTLNDLERRNTEFGKPVFQEVTVSICCGMYARVCCILYCVYDVIVKKVHVCYLIS